MNKLPFLRRATAALVCAAAGWGCTALAAAPAADARAKASGESQPLKVLRYAFLIAETTFDPPQITDLYSRTVAASIFDAPFEYAFLARPARMRTNTAAAMPEISQDFKTFT